MLLLERGTVAGSPAYFLCERGEITHPYLSRDIAVKKINVAIFFLLSKIRRKLCFTATKQPPLLNSLIFYTSDVTESQIKKRPLRLIE
jgi:hypothetical protein